MFFHENINDKRELKWMNPFTGKEENIECSVDEKFAGSKLNVIDAEKVTGGKYDQVSIYRKMYEGTLNFIEMENDNEKLTVEYNPDGNGLTARHKYKTGEEAEYTYVESDRHKKPSFLSQEISKKTKDANSNQKGFLFGKLQWKNEYSEKDGIVTQQSTVYNSDSVSRKTYSASKIDGVAYDQLDYVLNREVTVWADGHKRVEKDGISTEYSSSGEVLSVHDHSTPEPILANKGFRNRVEIVGDEDDYLAAKQRVLEKLAAYQGISPEDRGKTGKGDDKIKKNAQHGVEFLKEVGKIGRNKVR